jgi:hypothetical protein
MFNSFNCEFPAKADTISAAPAVQYCMPQDQASSMQNLDSSDNKKREKTIRLM